MTFPITPTTIEIKYIPRNKPSQSQPMVFHALIQLVAIPNIPSNALTAQQPKHAIVRNRKRIVRSKQGNNTPPRVRFKVMLRRCVQSQLAGAQIRLGGHIIKRWVFGCIRFHRFDWLTGNMGTRKISRVAFRWWRKSRFSSSDSGYICIVEF